MINSNIKSKHPNNQRSRQKNHSTRNLDARWNRLSQQNKETLKTNAKPVLHLLQSEQLHDRQKIEALQGQRPFPDGFSDLPLDFKKQMLDLVKSNKIAQTFGLHSESELKTSHKIKYLIEKFKSMQEENERKNAPKYFSNSDSANNVIKPKSLPESLNIGPNESNKHPSPNHNAIAEAKPNVISNIIPPKTPSSLKEAIDIISELGSKASVDKFKELFYSCSEEQVKTTFLEKCDEEQLSYIFNNWDLDLTTLILLIQKLQDKFDTARLVSIINKFEELESKQKIIEACTKEQQISIANKVEIDNVKLNTFMMNKVKEYISKDTKNQKYLFTICNTKIEQIEEMKIKKTRLSELESGELASLQQLITEIQIEIAKNDDLEDKDFNVLMSKALKERFLKDIISPCIKSFQYKYRKKTIFTKLPPELQKTVAQEYDEEDKDFILFMVETLRDNYPLKQVIKHLESCEYKRDKKELFKKLSPELQKTVAQEYDEEDKDFILFMVETLRDNYPSEQLTKHLNSFDDLEQMMLLDMISTKLFEKLPLESQKTVAQEYYKEDKDFILFMVEKLGADYPSEQLIRYFNSYTNRRDKEELFTELTTELKKTVALEYNQKDDQFVLFMVKTLRDNYPLK